MELIISSGSTIKSAASACARIAAEWQYCTPAPGGCECSACQDWVSI
jgi:hypothetical protein